MSSCEAAAYVIKCNVFKASVELIGIAAQRIGEVFVVTQWTHERRMHSVNQDKYKKLR